MSFLKRHFSAYFGAYFWAIFLLLKWVPGTSELESLSWKPNNDSKVHCGQDLHSLLSFLIDKENSVVLWYRFSAVIRGGAGGCRQPCYSCSCPRTLLLNGESGWLRLSLSALSSLRTHRLSPYIIPGLSVMILYYICISRGGFTLEEDNSQKIEASKCRILEDWVILLLQMKQMKANGWEIQVRGEVGDS